MAKLRTKAQGNRVLIDTSEELLVLLFHRFPSGSWADVVRNGRPTGLRIHLDGAKDGDGYGRARAEFESIVPDDRVHSCPHCRRSVRV